MRPSEAINQLRPKLSLRGRLYLFSGAILILFAINVATSLWGSFARNESSLAYQEAVTAAQLTAELQQNLQNKRQQILVLATLRETTDEPLEETAIAQARADLAIISERLRQLGGYGGEELEAHYRRLHESATVLLEEWRQFYERYNHASPMPEIESARSYNNAQQRLQELDQRQSFVAVQRASTIDDTIRLTDQITVIGFIGSIAITLALVFAMIRSTNASLTRMKRGVERFGSGDLTYRIDEERDSGEIGDLARTFNEMSGKLQTAIEEMNTARADADSANAAKSMFLANVSHELRTPLNAIIGYSEMLQDELGDGIEIDRGQFHHDLATIIFSGKQLLTLINDILDLSKIETGKMRVSRETFNPSALLVQVCDALSPLLLQRDNELILDIDKDSMRDIHSDRGKLQQIVTNLFSNACKFTEKGQITVSAHMTEDQLLIAVKDTGIGMTPAQQGRVFDAFTQAESDTGVKYGGTGLGLAIVKEFCAMLGGDISLESQLGEGSTFCVSLPAAPA
jgi:signal transduction histidine kinase